MESPEKALVAAGILEGGAQPRLKRMRGFTCDVCYNEDGTKETLALSCDMRCMSSPPSCPSDGLETDEGIDCKECYSEYVTNKIVDEGESRRIQCMGSNCHVIVDEKTIELLVAPDVFTRYVLFLCEESADETV